MCESDHFKQVFDKPNHNLKSHAFRIMVRPNGLSKSRLGTVVAKRHLKLAVKRNQVKRVIRAGFQENCLGLNAFDVVVIYTSRKPIDSHEMHACLRSQWKKLEV